MKRLVLLIVTLFFISFSVFSQSDKSKLIGLWKSINQEELIYMHLDNEGYVYMINNGDTVGGKNFNIRNQTGSMYYKIDTSKTPKTLDFIVDFDDKEKEDKTLFGIYMFDENGNLIICQNYKGEIRLTEFDKQSTIIFEKVKKK